MLQKIRRWLLRLQWHQQHYEPHIEKSLDEHKCPYCKEVYVGNLCPQCGLQEGRERLTAKTVGLNMMDLWGLGNRNAFVTMWHLLWRPGYMIADYLRGKSRAYFTPIALLVALCLIFTLMVSGLGIDFDNSQNIGEAIRTQIAQSQAQNQTQSIPDTPTDKILEEAMQAQVKSLADILKKMQAWSNSHLEQSLLIYNLVFILITSWVFRRSPRLGHLTLIENFYVQMFIDCQMMLIAIPYTLLTQSVASSEIYPYFIPSALALVILIYDYYQLCGFGLWRTVWKVLLMTAVYSLATGVITFTIVLLYVIVPPIIELIKADPPV